MENVDFSSKVDGGGREISEISNRSSGYMLAHWIYV
jgi:hypothetical protein